MLDKERIKRVLGGLVRAPLRLERVDQTVAALGGRLDQDLGDLRAQLASLSETVNASSKANLDSLVFMTRSIEGLSARLEKLVKDVDDQQT
jgi:hypothetical protein